MSGFCYTAFVKIVLVVTGAKRTNLLFVTRDLHAYPLDEALNLVEKGLIEGVHAVRARISNRIRRYLRANPNEDDGDNLDAVALSVHRLFRAVEDVTALFDHPGFREYWRLYTDYLKDFQARGDEIISIDGLYRTPKKFVVERLRDHRQHVIPAARRFAIDPYTLGAIVIDECARYSVLDILTDDILLTLRNPSVGIAQVALETARTLIKAGYYNPDPADPRLSAGRIDAAPRELLYAYVVIPKHNIRFAAARVRFLIDRWADAFNISDRPDIIGTLYSAKDSGKQPRGNPEPNARGRQIQREFYPLARSILGPLP